MDTAALLSNNLLFVEIIKSDKNSKAYGKDISVINCKEEPLLNGGYASSLIRVKVEYTIDTSKERKARSYVIKMPMTNQVINENVFVENELSMYDKVIPKIMEVSNLRVAPIRFRCSLPDCLVLEDLVTAGYSMCDAVDRLDFKHTEAVLLTLAKFHAATVAVKHKYSDVIEENGKEWLFTNDPKIRDHFKPKILIRLYGLARVLQETPGCKRYGDVLINAGEAFWDLMVELHKPNGKLNVLIHGDFWTNNLMFRYDSAGCVAEVKFVDYQMRRFCSPAIDLLQLFWTSVDDAARLQMYELLEMYRHTLNSSLSELGCPERLSEEDLKEEIAKCSPKTLLICLFLPLTMPDKSSPLDVSTLEDSEASMVSTDFNVNPLLAPFKQKHYRTLLLGVCKEIEARGIFEILVKV